MCATLTMRHYCTVFCKHRICAMEYDKASSFLGIRENQFNDEIRTHAYQIENFFAKSRRSWHRIRILVRYQWWWVERLNWHDRLCFCTRCLRLNNHLLSVTTDHHQPFCLYERITLLEKNFSNARTLRETWRTHQRHLWVERQQNTLNVTDNRLVTIKLLDISIQPNSNLRAYPNEFA